MCPVSKYPQNYLDSIQKQTITPIVVVEIEGIDFLSTAPLFKRIRYGDPGVEYGDPIVYGQLIPRDDFRDIMSIDVGSLKISQTIEPESGRGNTTLMTLAFIDKDEYMSQVISPGVLIPEILGQRVRIHLGMQGTSFPEDFFTVFRGYVSRTQSNAGMVTMQLSDASLKRRQELFKDGKSELTSDILAADTTIPVNSTANFYDHILGPDGTYDTSVKTYVRIGDEIIEYGPGDLTPTSITNAIRGARGTAAEDHDEDDEVTHAIEVTGNAYDLLLKLMLSGWNGHYKTAVPLVSVVTTDIDTGPVSNGVVLDGLDAIEDLGIAEGSYFDIVGGPNAGSYTVVGFMDFQEFPNRIVLLSQALVDEPVAAGTASLRSQFDTFPVFAGLKLDPLDVDVATHLSIRNDFLSQDQMQFFRDQAETGKTFLESQIHLPMRTYSITRYGRISAAVNRPPIADQTIPELNIDNILNPQEIAVERAINNRRLFNSIKYVYDRRDDGTYASVAYEIDTDSLTKIGISQVLPIVADGIRTALNGAAIATKNGQYFLSRFKNGAYEIPVKTNFMVGGRIELADSVLLRDDGTLFITNFSTGRRDLGAKLFEVIGRELDIKSGICSLKLLSTIGYEVNDRFATIAPSSLVASGTTTSAVITGSFGEVYPGQEYRKWEDLVGQEVVVHDDLWTVSGVTTFTGFDTGNPFKMNFSPALAFTPLAGYIVDLAEYAVPDPAVGEVAKTLFTYVDPTVPIVTGISPTQFTVSAPDAAKFTVGLPVLVRSADWSTLSPEVAVTDITGVTITVSAALGFTPALGQYVELIGFTDGGGPYRIL